MAVREMCKWNDGDMTHERGNVKGGREGTEWEEGEGREGDGKSWSKN